MIKNIALIFIVGLIAGCSKHAVTNINGEVSGSYELNNCVTISASVLAAVKENPKEFEPKCDSGFEYCRTNTKIEVDKYCIEGFCKAPSCK